MKGGDGICEGSGNYQRENVEGRDTYILTRIFLKISTTATQYCIVSNNIVLYCSILYSTIKYYLVHNYTVLYSTNPWIQCNSLGPMILPVITLWYSVRNILSNVEK